MFQDFIVQPIFNLLSLIYALLPGHNFGLSIIIFTIVIRFLMWPLVRRQMRQTKAMRELQPDIKRIKKASKGNRQQESLMLMELYKERGISPFSSIGTLIVQLIILIGLYSGLIKVVNDPAAIVTFSYDWLQNLGTLKEIAANPAVFDNTLFGAVDLSRPALSQGTIYFPALLLVIGSAVAQFYQSKQLMPNDADARGLRQILREASEGKQADSSETNAAVARSMKYIIPVMIFVFTIGLASALSLYWFVGGLVAYWQQARLLNKEESNMEKTPTPVSNKDKTTVRILEGEVITKETVNGKTVKTNTKKRSPKKQAKRRKR